MATTIEYLRKINQASLGLDPEWLSRLQVVAQNDIVSGLAEIIVVESADGSVDFQQRMDAPAIMVPSNHSPQPVAKTVQTGDVIFSEAVVDDIPDTVVAPSASPVVPERKPDVQTQPTIPKQDNPTQDKTVQDIDILDLQDVADVKLRIDKAHIPSPNLFVDVLNQRSSESSAGDPASKEDKAKATDIKEARLKVKEVKLIVDRILKQYPPVSSAILMFVPSSTSHLNNNPAGTSRHHLTVRAIATELASRTNEQILHLDAIRDNGAAQDKSDQNAIDRGALNVIQSDNLGDGLAEVINRNEPVENVVQNTDVDNLSYMHSGESELTVRKTRPITLVKLTARLREQFQYVCIAAPSVNEVVTKTLSRYSEVCYLIVDLDNTDQNEARDRVDMLRRAGARIGGCIVRQQVDLDV